MVLALAAPHALVGVFYDDGVYAALAKSLATGHGYHLLYLPGTPGAVHYPILYPAFLAALWLLAPSFPANAPLMAAANAVLMAAFAGILAAYLARLVPGRPWIAAVATLIAVLSVPLVAVTTMLFSEPLFLVLAALACWCADWAAEREGRALGPAALAGALAGLTMLTRSIGLAVVVGVGVALWRARRRAAAAVACGAALVVVAPWLAWSAAHGGDVEPVLVANYGTYGALLKQSGLGWIGAGSLVGFVRPLGALALPPGPAIARLAAGLLLLGALVLGVRALLRRAPAAGWMLLAYLVIVALWPYAPDRFVWAALPWLLCAFAAGVHDAVTRSGAHAVWWRGAGIAAAVLVGLGMVPRQAIGLAHGDATRTARGISATFAQVLPWIRTATDTSAVVASEDEALIWLYTGRRAVPSYLWRVRGREAESFGPDTLRAFLRRSGATHLVLTGLASDAAPTIDALLAREPGFLHLVRVWPGPIMAFAVWQPPAGSGP